jgi:hypothetical protein
MQHTMVYGTTEAQTFQLLDDGENLVGTGLTVTIEFRESGVSASVAWLSQSGGTVSVTGMTGMELERTYHFRFKLVDGTGKIGYCPNDFSADQWYVTKV